MVEAHGIAWHEKALGQLFCDGSSQQIVDMLLDECGKAGVTIALETEVKSVSKGEGGFTVETSRGRFEAASLVVATGGKSIPKMGATGFGYDLARQFGLPVVPLRPALVPFTFGPELRAQLEPLSGVSVDATVACGKQDVVTALSRLLPKSLAERWCERAGVEGRLADLSDKRLRALAGSVNAWALKPQGTEGFRTAEVTAGGVDTRGLSSKTMEARDHPGLYFIGEVLDVTGHLGGFNFQWAWASGFAAGQNI
jgi:hypothetical protein